MLLQKETKKHSKITQNFRNNLKDKQIEVINGVEPTECRKDFMKIKFESDDHLPLDETFNIPDMIIVIASVLEKNGKYYPHIFLHECADKF